jgi:hypothetical protein
MIAILIGSAIKLIGSGMPSAIRPPDDESSLFSRTQGLSRRSDGRCGIAHTVR